MFYFFAVKMFPGCVSFVFVVTDPSVYVFYVSIESCCSVVESSALYVSVDMKRRTFAKRAGFYAFWVPEQSSIVGGTNQRPFTVFEEDCLRVATPYINDFPLQPSYLLWNHKDFLEVFSAVAALNADLLFATTDGEADVLTKGWHEIGRYQTHSELGGLMDTIVEKFKPSQVRYLEA